VPDGGERDRDQLTVVLAPALPVARDRIESAREAVRASGVGAEVVVASDAGSYRERVAAAIGASTSGYVLLADPARVSGEIVEALWRERQGTGLVLAAGTPAVPADASAARAVRIARRVLSLPVLPDASLVLLRREALPVLPLAATRFEWLLEAIVHVNADGWPITRIGPDRIVPPDEAGASVSTLYRLWVTRNSAFSADYDERAYNSLIPLQRYWQRARYRIITGFVDPRSRILDIGCGSSRIVQSLPRAVGLDIQLKKLRRISSSSRRLVQATITRLPFREAAFETLICSQVIEHVPEPLVDWREFNRVLAPGGTFVVGTPDYATLAWPLLEWAYDIVHPKGYVNEHINRYTAASLRACLEQHGFAVTASAYVGGGELIYRAQKVADC
jgi:ubiquinone/menaquinone biosynthesis C-methylase UbiE